MGAQVKVKVDTQSVECRPSPKMREQEKWPLFFFKFLLPFFLTYDPSPVDFFLHHVFLEAVTCSFSVLSVTSSVLVGLLCLVQCTWNCLLIPLFLSTVLPGAPSGLAFEARIPGLPGHLLLPRGGCFSLLVVLIVSSLCSSCLFPTPSHMTSLRPL